LQPNIRLKKKHTLTLTQERFHRLLDNPELLATISHEELKTLALAYPYAHNLRYLLAIKSQQSEHADADRTLATAAAYSLDRRQLFLLVAPQLTPQRVSTIIEEAILELKPLDVVQRELEALTPQPRVEKTEKVAVLEPPTPAPEEKPAEAIVLDFSQPKQNLPVEVSKNQEPPPIKLAQPFAVWMSRFNPPVLAPTKNVEAPPPKEEEAPSPTLSAQVLAERSVAENKDVISETLARLLAKQGYRDKAINMYERLRLAFPDKSAYFAAEIEKLKK